MVIPTCGKGRDADTRKAGEVKFMFLGDGEGLEPLFLVPPPFPPPVICFRFHGLFARAWAAAATIRRGRSVNIFFRRKVKKEKKNCLKRGVEERRYHLLTLSSKPVCDLQDERGMEGKGAMCSIARRAYQAARDINLCLFVCFVRKSGPINITTTLALGAEIGVSAFHSSQSLWFFFLGWVLFATLMDTTICTDRFFVAWRF